VDNKSIRIGEIVNYIFIHKSYGAVSMAMTQDKMENEIILIAKKSSGDWQARTPMGTWSELSHPMNILHIPANNIINWGNHIFSDDRHFKLNVPSAIANASNKGRARIILQEVGVKVPFTTQSPNLEVYRDMKYPVIVRPNFHHGGQHFHVFNSLQELRGFLWGKNMADFYVSELFEKTTEYRVHCGHGKVLFIQEKPLVEGEIRANQAVNHESWTVLKWSDFHPGICRESILAVGNLGLDYGAVDIMYNAQNDTWAICEVNTSPSINTPYSSEKYAKYFDWVIRHNFPEHLALEDGKNIFYSKMLRE
jgi:hypothetical protein